jgi:hypothetical protein
MNIFLGPLSVVQQRIIKGCDERMYDMTMHNPRPVVFEWAISRPVTAFRNRSC